LQSILVIYHDAFLALIALFSSVHSSCIFSFCSKRAFFSSSQSEDKAEI